MTPYHGETEVSALSGSAAGQDRLRRTEEEGGQNPLKGKKIAAYYGCLLLRPGKVMQMDNPENPKIMEDFIRAIGAEPVIYPHAKRMLRRIYDPGGKVRGTVQKQHR